MSTTLEQEFEAAMINSAEQAREIGYNPTRFNLMVRQNGGLETAKKLLSTSQVSQGFTTLWEKKRLDLSLEALVLQPKWETLFTSEEIEEARSRLIANGYLKAP